MTLPAHSIIPPYSDGMESREIGFARTVSMTMRTTCP
ncbi:hypothetical protein GGQ72_002114 [Rhizobium rhizoryzae]|jgi:hypothetical protein|uniref:Uncharacterized protein n=1 Tax=Rhizobium rhizoryzae TaxID=451876 RepID=A0A7W6LFX4_9HYPH|nr:hypothetical protein [Rhizobium rhizoryzae]